MGEEEEGGRGREWVVKRSGKQNKWKNFIDRDPIKGKGEAF